MHPKNGENIMDSIESSTIVVIVDQETLTWSNGVLVGDKQLVSTAKLASLVNLPVPLAGTGTTVTADIKNVDSPIHVIAAIFAAANGKAEIVKAPESVWKFFSGASSKVYAAA